MERTKKDDNPSISTQGCDIRYYQIFRYAKWYEILATLVGVFGALLSSVGVCYNIAQFGEICTAFVERTTFTEQTSSYLPLLSLFGGGRILTNASREENNNALMEDGAAMGIGMAVSVAISIVLCTISVALANWSALGQIKRIRHLFLEAVLRQDMSWYDTDTTFNLASRMSEDMLKLKEGMGEKLCVVANLVGTALISFCISIPLGWELTLVCTIIVPFSVGASIFLTRYQTSSAVTEMNCYSQAGKQAEEVLKSIRTIAAFSGEQKEIDRYGRLLRPAEKCGKIRGLVSGLGIGFNWVLTYALNSIGLAYGTRLVLWDRAKPAAERRYVSGDVFSIISGLYMATQSITFCVPHGESFAGACAAASTIFGLIERLPEVDSLDPTGLKPSEVRGDINLDDVSFGYPSRPDVKILKGFSIHVKPGETVALVGSSGCGKSTVLQLIQRLYDPHSGGVSLDGRNLKTLNLSWLRSSLGVVGQEPVLFRGSIYQNIIIGMSNVTKEDVIKAAKMAYAHEFITEFPYGYDTIIGERGTSLSGGQKQRIAIARSLIRNPNVLLLDEATSALDPQSEKEVQAALDRASHGRTTIVVSHRLSTIYNADRIVCMDQGAIVEQGTHEELLEKKGFYWKLINTGHSSLEPTLPLQDILESEKLLQELSRADSVRRSSKKRKSTSSNSNTRRMSEWASPRESISSVVSLGLQNVPSKLDGDCDVTKPDENAQMVSLWTLLKLNAPEWPMILIGSIAATFQGACFPAFAIIFGKAVGIYSYSDEAKILKDSDMYSGLFILVATVAGVSMFLQSTTFTTAGLKMTNRLRLQYFSSLLRQEMAYFDSANNTVGALCARLSGDVAAIQGATGIRIGLLLQGFSSVFIGFIVAVCHEWRLTLVGVAFLPLMVGSIWLEGFMSQKSGLIERNAMEDASSIATEAVVSIRTVQSLGVETVFLEKYDKALEVAVSAITGKTRWRGLVFGTGVYVPFVAFISCTIYGVHLIAYDEVPYDVIIMVVQAVMYGAYMLGHSLVYAPSFSGAKSCGARVLATINRVPKVKCEAKAMEMPRWSATGKFNIKAVEFAYPSRPNQMILKGIDLKVGPGKKVALVGSSGCGKSTILQLIQRFYDPTSGNIELDNKDGRYDLTVHQLRRQLGVVQQEPILFDRSIAENIAYGDNTRAIAMQEIVDTAKAANIHGFIASLPQGYATNLGSAGAQLSGGQKQRICIARALIRSPRLLLLDEATSALDANSEKVVTDALEVASKGRTCITVAHRLSTIKDADIICVIVKGKIVEKGTHAELVYKRGHYYKMCRGQHMT